MLGHTLIDVPPSGSVRSCASTSSAADDSGSPAGGDEAAVAPEVPISMKVRQSPLMAVVSPPACTMWRQEAEVMRDIGKGLRCKALSLPSDSVLRDRLFDEAECWLLQARMRGLPLDAAASA